MKIGINYYLFHIVSDLCLGFVFIDHFFYDIDNRYNNTLDIGIFNRVMKSDNNIKLLRCDIY